MSSFSLKYIFLGFFLLTTAAYVNSINNPFIWDDEQFIYANKFVTNFAVFDIFTQSTTAGAGVISTYYRPLTSLSYAFDYYLWGELPVGFHVKNISLHLIAGCALFFLLKHNKVHQRHAIILTLFFLLHPIQTESVTYINSRGDSLYAAWLFFGLLCFSLLLQKKELVITLYDLHLTVTTRIAAIGAVLGYVCSILSKEIGIAGLGLFILIAAREIMSAQSSAKRLQLIKRAAPLISLLIGVAAAYLLTRQYFLRIDTELGYSWGIDSVYTTNIFVRMHTFARAFWEYLRFLIIPYPLHMERNIPIMTSFISGWLVGALITILTTFFLGLFEYAKKKTTNILFGLSWFFIMLLPVSGIIPVNALVYEHWLYVPMIGFWLVLLGFIQLINWRQLSSFLWKIGVPMLLVLYAVLTVRQNYIWGDHIRFYTYTLSFGQSARLHNNLAIALANSGKYAEAIEQYEASLQISTEYYQTYFNLGNAQRALGELELAKQSYEQSLKINPHFLPAKEQHAAVVELLRLAQE